MPNHTHRYGGWFPSGGECRRNCSFCPEYETRSHNYGSWESGFGGCWRKCQTCNGHDTKSHAWSPWTLYERITSRSVRYRRSCSDCGKEEEQTRHE